jgi:hypothetical protein
MTGEGRPCTLRGATEGPTHQEHQTQDGGLAGLINGVRVHCGTRARPPVGDHAPAEITSLN